MNPERDVVCGRCALTLPEMIEVVLLYLRKYNSQRSIAEHEVCNCISQRSTLQTVLWLTLNLSAIAL